MQHWGNHVTFLKHIFSQAFFEERIIFMIWIVRDYVLDHFSFYLNSLALNRRSYSSFSENNINDVT